MALVLDRSVHTAIQMCTPRSAAFMNRSGCDHDVGCFAPYGVMTLDASAHMFDVVADNTKRYRTLILGARDRCTVLNTLGAVYQECLPLSLCQFYDCCACGG